MTMMEIRNRARPQLDQLCLLHGVRMVKKSNRQVAGPDLHMLQIVLCLVWLVIVSTLGMTRKENRHSTLLISHRRGNINRVADNSTESKKFKLLGGQGATSNAPWEKCSIKILNLEQTFFT